MATISEEAQEWQIDAIQHALHTKRISYRAAMRILAIMDDQPALNEGLPSQTEVARQLKEWTETNNSKKP